MQENILLPKEKLELYINIIRQIQDGKRSIYMDDSVSVPERGCSIFCVSRS